MRIYIVSSEGQRPSRYFRRQRAGVCKVCRVPSHNRDQSNSNSRVLERTYPHARYERSQSSSHLMVVPSGDDMPPVRWSSVLDPNSSGSLPPEAHPITITVSAGESLYLPAGWWHHVRQTGLTVAVNYWYDIEGRGASWVWLNLLRGPTKPPEDETEYPDQSE